MQKTKVVVFDFDNTLYMGIDWTKEWAEFCEKGLRFVFRDWDDKRFEKMIKDENLVNYTSDGIIKVIQKYNKNVEDWITFRTINDCDLDYSNVISISEEVLKSFANNFKLYIVSNSTHKDIEDMAFRFDIDLSLFKEIIINDYKHGAGKKYFYEEIIKKEKIKPSELFVIGDSENNDVIPALELGARGKVVKDCNFKMEDFDL